MTHWQLQLANELDAEPRPTMKIGRTILALIATATLAAFTLPTSALERPVSELEELDALLGEMMAAVDAEERKLLEQMARIGKDAHSSALPMSKRVTNLDAYRGGQDVSALPPGQVGEEQKAEREQAQKSSIPELPRISPEVGGVLTPKGRFVMEPSLRYLHSTVNRVSIEGLTILPALLVGVIDVIESDRDTFSASLTSRYGITSRLEAELNVPYLWRSDSTRTRKFLDSASEESSISADGNGIGDVEVGLRYQFNRGRNGWPYFTGNLRVKSDTGTGPFELATKSSLGDAQLLSELPTGSGFWSVNPSMTIIYPSDPVVFFGNVGYLWTQEDDKGSRVELVDGEEITLGFGKVDPGDAVRLNFGMGLGLNERASMSLSYSLDSFSETTIENSATNKVAGSDVTVGRLLLGFSLRTPKGTPLNLAIGIGATDDAPDTDVSFRMPINFFN
jgi:hypothetical protein